MFLSSRAVSPNWSLSLVCKLLVLSGHAVEHLSQMRASFSGAEILPTILYKLLCVIIESSSL